MDAAPTAAQQPNDVLPPPPAYPGRAGHDAYPKQPGEPVYPPPAFPGPPGNETNQPGEPGFPQQPGFPAPPPPAFPGPPGHEARHPGGHVGIYPQQPGCHPVQGHPAITQQPTHVVLGTMRLLENPVAMTCPYCQASIVTATMYEPSTLTWIACGTVAIMG